AFKAGEGERVDLGTLKVVPPRQGDAGTFGMAVSADGGVLSVSSVKPGGPAEQAGIQTGDKIISIYGQAVAELGADHASQFLSSGEVGIGVTVPLELERGGQKVQATVTSVKW